MVLRSVCALLFLIGSTASASTLIPATFEELSRQADVVVVATVGAQQARFNDDRTLILTHTALDVEETIAGPTAATLELSEYGGRVDGLVLVVPGLPRFAEGQRVLMFLCYDALGLLRTCGATQGRMRVRTSPDGTTRASGVMAGRPIDDELSRLRRRVLAARREDRP